LEIYDDIKDESGKQKLESHFKPKGSNQWLSCYGTSYKTSEVNLDFVWEMIQETY